MCLFQWFSFLCLVIQRRKRDSNPRTLAGQRFSRPPHSTALASLRDWGCKSRNYLVNGKETGAFYAAGNGTTFQCHRRHIASDRRPEHLPIPRNKSYTPPETTCLKSFQILLPANLNLECPVMLKTLRFKLKYMGCRELWWRNTS